MKFAVSHLKCSQFSHKKKKIVGSAQVRKENCFLQHGSILLNENQEETGELLPIEDEYKKRKIIEYLGRKTISINNILKNKIDFNSAVNYLILGFKKEWNSQEFVLDNHLSSYEKDMITNLISNKYKKDSWNYRR